MRLQEIVASLPESWVMRGNCRAQKRPMTTQQKRAALEPYEIGLMRLKEMMLPHCLFTEQQVIEIGKCSINRKYIMVVREGKSWVIVGLTSANAQAYKGNGYIIKGKKTIPLQHHKQGSLEQLMRDFESKSSDIPLNLLDADGLFHAFQGRRIYKGKKKGQYGFAEQGRSVHCKTESYSRPWKRGERVHMRSENAKRREQIRKEQEAAAFFKVAKYGLCSPNKLQIKYFD